MIFLFSFSIIFHLPHLTSPPFFWFRTLSSYLYQFLASLSSPSFFLFFFVLFLRIFFFPLLLLQFEFYAFIIDNDFGMGLIKGSDFGRRKQKFWVEKIVILASSSSPSSFFNFELIIYMNLYMGLMNFYMGLMKMGVLLMNL